MNVYCDLKKVCPELDTLDIGGGLPIENSLNFDFDVDYMIGEMVDRIRTSAPTTRWTNRTSSASSGLHRERQRRHLLQHPEPEEAERRRSGT